MRFLLVLSVFVWVLALVAVVIALLALIPAAIAWGILYLCGIQVSFWLVWGIATLIGLTIRGYEYKLLKALEEV